MMILKLAYQNIIGAGLRTWLNVIVLSVSFVVIIWLQGFYIGMGDQATTAKVDSEIGGGQYWCKNYDPYDPFSIEDSHSALPPNIQNLVQNKRATPILVAQATIYPQGRPHSVLLKGILPGQKILNIPTEFLNTKNSEITPALIGAWMAKSSNLQIGDYVTVRWRDVNGTFDAVDVQIAQIMKTTVPSIDIGQLWLPLGQLQKMLNLPDEATLVVLKQGDQPVVGGQDWVFRDLDYLLKEIEAIVQGKTVGASIFYVFLLLLALLAIFDTQILAIFKRRKEIGTLIALGMTRGKVIRLFTVEGGIHGILAAMVAAIYGIPLMIMSAKVGWGLPEDMDTLGFSIDGRLFPAYSVGLVAGTTLLILVSVTFVSFLPTRKIAKLKPTDALKGKKSW